LNAPLMYAILMFVFPDDPPSSSSKFMSRCFRVNTYLTASDFFLSISVGFYPPVAPPPPARYLTECAFLCSANCPLVPIWRCPHSTWCPLMLTPLKNLAPPPFLRWGSFGFSCSCPFCSPCFPALPRFPLSGCFGTLCVYGCGCFSCWRWVACSAGRLEYPRVLIIPSPPGSFPFFLPI